MTMGGTVLAAVLGSYFVSSNLLVGRGSHERRGAASKGDTYGAAQDREVYF